MIAQVETLNYHSLRYIRQGLEPFEVLIGPNASGKSTFLDVIAFLADMVREKEGVNAAVATRAPDMGDLTWMRCGGAFELVVEAIVPPHLRRQKNGQSARLRYEVSVGLHAPGQEVSLLAETLWLRPDPAGQEVTAPPRTLFPLPQPPPATVIHSPGQPTPQGWRRIVLADPCTILCFGRDELGATDIVRGSEHPRLAAWKHETDFGTLFAAGVLG
jgi:hypothetical protein